MSGPSVVVDRAPDGWTHIGGPGMHLLIGLDEDDDRTLAASDAADGGDIDDVVEVLTTGGMRKAHHFVGVHWQPRTRIVAFGPVSALVTLADGTEHDVRAPSARVWTDLELPEHPERVVLRVLDESERAQPVPPQHLVAGVPAGPAVGVAPESSVPVAGSAAPVASAPTRADDASVAEGASPPDVAPAVEEPAAVTSVAVSPAGTAASTASTPARPVNPPAAPVNPPAAPAIPTFGAASAGDGGAPSPGPGTSPWGRSWARRDAVHGDVDEPAAHVSQSSHGAVDPARAVADPVEAQERRQRAADAPSAARESGATHPAPESAPAAAPALRSWGSVTPAAPVRSVSKSASRAPAAPAAPAPVSAPPAAAAEAVVPEAAVPEVEVPVATDLPPAPQRDVDSTWAARPVPQGDPSPPAPATASASASAEGSATTPDTDGDDPQVAAPSYDYLFGHTTAADEHRKVLAQLTQPADDEGAHEDDEVLSVPAVADTSDAAVTNAAPAPEVPERPIPSAPEVPQGGLISSVPWATPASAPAPKPEAEVPTFSGRPSPPAAPSLLPPVNTPPPGARAPEATPLISTGPPPAVRDERPGADQPDVHQHDAWAAPHATPVLRTPPTVPIATTPPSAPTPQPVPGAEPSFDVPIGRAPVSATASATTDPAGGSGGNAPQAAWVDPSDAAADDDETELTVDRSALLEARNAALNQTFSGPSVLAVLCSAGHPTPPHSDRCRVCGTGIPPQEPFTMPRPPLGVLRLSTGDVVTLDRSVLLGRAPKLGEGLAAHDRPHVVKVPSPERDVSRNHVEVILEGWHVLIRDLGTTNGTTVTLPGDTPVRLRANDQQVLEPGSLVSMADEVSFTFEAAP